MYISLSISSQQFPFCRSPTLPLLRPVGSIWPGGGSKKIFRVDGGRCWSSSSSSSSTDFGAYTRLQKGYNIYGIINSSWLTSIGLHDVLMPSARQIIDSPSLLVSLSRSLSLIPRFSLAGWLYLSRLVITNKRPSCQSARSGGYRGRRRRYSRAHAEWKLIADCDGEEFDRWQLGGGWKSRSNTEEWGAPLMIWPNDGRTRYVVW